MLGQGSLKAVWGSAVGVRRAASASRTPQESGRKAGQPRVRGVGEQAERGGLDRFPESEHPAGPLRSRGAGSGSSPGGSRGDKTGEITRRGGSTPPESNPVSGANTLSGKTSLKEARAT